MISQTTYNRIKEEYGTNNARRISGFTQRIQELESIKGLSHAERNSLILLLLKSIQSPEGSSQEVVNRNEFDEIIEALNE